MTTLTRTVGLMSGTSLDGIDSAFVETDGRAIVRLLLCEFTNLQHLSGQVAGWLHAFKVAQLGSGMQAGNIERTDLSVQGRGRQTWALVLGTQRRSCQRNHHKRSGDVLEVSPFCHVIFPEAGPVGSDV